MNILESIRTTRDGPTKSTEIVFDFSAERHHAVRLDCGKDMKTIGEELIRAGQAMMADANRVQRGTPEQALVDFYQAYTAWREPEIKAVEWLAMGAEVKRTYHALAGWELDSFSGYEDLLRILVRCWSAYIHSMPADSDRLKILSDLDSAVRAIGLALMVRGLTAPSISNTMTDPSS